jgi:hypothetical protein
MHPSRVWTSVHDRSAHPQNRGFRHNRPAEINLASYSAHFLDVAKSLQVYRSVRFKLRPGARRRSRVSRSRGFSRSVAWNVLLFPRSDTRPEQLRMIEAEPSHGAPHLLLFYPMMAYER